MLTKAGSSRFCGEHFASNRGTGETAGSSPLARGTRPDRNRSWVFLRFIPAHAGNTRAVDMGANHPPVHPRSRGEHMSSAMRYQSCAGLSPLARGTLIKRRLHVRKLRFIPAHAGNTSAMALPRTKTAVYPRSRGEHLAGSAGFTDEFGLSPLARGTHTDSCRLRPQTRFIPARAGNTMIRCAFSMVSAVHPRSRGEHCLFCVKSRLRIGSSPLTRGTL